MKYTNGFNLIVGQSWSSVWVKIITGWLAILLYLWTVVAPVCYIYIYIYYLIK